MVGAGDADSTVNRLIEAGLASLLELTPADLVTAIGTRTIAARAGVSAATLINRFGSVAGFADALVARVFDPGVLPVEERQGRIVDIIQAGLPAEMAEAYHRADFDYLTADREFRLRMGLWALGGGTTDLAYRTLLRITEDRLVAHTEAMVNHWGREFRPPFSTREFIAVHTALINGLTVRHLIEPELSTKDRYALTATAVSMILMRLQGDQHDLVDRIAEMNYYPLRHARTGAVVTEAVGRTRARLLAAAGELFGARGYEETTAAQIARHARVSTSSLYKQFGGKAGVATALFSKQAEDLMDERARRIAAESDSVAEYLGDVARFVGNRTEYAAAYLTDLVTHRARTEDPLVGGLLPLVERAMTQAGTTATDQEPDPGEVAQVLLGALIGRVLARPADGPQVHARAVISLVLGGALVPADPR